MRDSFWMEEALKLAFKAQAENEVPVGAVLVDENDTLLGQGYNQVRQNNNPLLHAELIAIESAAAKIKNYRLNDSTLYTTLEPCAMCAGAIVQARIKRVVFACRDFKAGAAGSVYNLLQGYPLNHQVQIDEGFLQHECAHLLADFFKQRR
ncbi:MAG: tRNA adenosine(34) deaminase TadA [Proteobacteria bacterium]|nr:tRNA adenosine(34) deaminase TadA [Pseudomonadota bacterium]